MPLPRVPLMQGSSHMWSPARATTGFEQVADRLAAACREAFADFDSRVYAGLTEAELETLDRLLEKVLVNLAAGDDSYAPGPPVCGIDYGKNRNGENV